MRIKLVVNIGRCKWVILDSVVTFFSLGFVYLANIIIFASLIMIRTMIDNLNKFNRWNNIVGWMVFFVATLSYLMTMEPTASLWDCSEFIATSYKLEVGHPPGAPLFMILARLASMLAPSPEAVPMMINAMNAVASGFCILFLFWTITHLARRVTITDSTKEMSLSNTILVLGSGVVGALSYAYTDTFWFSAVEGEVYALSSMFTALVVWLMLKWEENAHRATSMRWIVFIAYLMGLSIGVHILNLLTIPALVMIYFFRCYEYRSAKDYFLKICLALVVSLVILGAINGIIIPYTVALGAVVDTFAVNSLGLPVNVGMVAFVVAVFALLGYLILFTHKRGYRVLNTLAMAVTVILIGFSSYASVSIRAAANPPMNSNDPSTPHKLLSLLNRDQYGDRPLLVGPYYSAMPLSLVEPNFDYMSEDEYLPTGNYSSKSMMWLNPETGKYEEREIFDGYIYPKEANRILPRMWYYSRRGNYEEGWVNMVNGHPSVYVEDSTGGSWYEPTALEDINYFLGYQMGDMFWRYFMWNFVGRQDDNQLQSDAQNRIYLNGGWLSGIDALDKFYVGPRTLLPSEMENNPAHNGYFFLPLLLGLLGLIYQLNVDWRNFFVVSLLFVMMGIALVVYFNTAPDEPRERDYVYAGAFYAFSIWLGLGVMAIGDLLMSLFARLSKQGNRVALTASIVAVLMSVSVPVVLASENWDDHDRSNRYVARDIGRNYLNTVPKNGIIINYGDNDTFPLWYCQEVEGVRPDVRIMNSSYLGGEWYIDEMKLAANEADGVPFTIPSTKYSFVNDWTILANPIDVLDTDKARKLRRERRRIDSEGYYQIEYIDISGRKQVLTGTYGDISKKIGESQKVISEYQPYIEQYISKGDTASDGFYDVYVPYAVAQITLDAITNDALFMADYDKMEEYWEFNDAIAECDMLLSDAIRLFVSDAPMSLAINGGRIYILGEGETIPVEERQEDYRMMGKLKSKVDSFFDGLDSDYILAAKRYVIPVDKANVVASGILTEEEAMEAVDEVYISLGGKSMLTKDHLMMLDLFANFDWKRPLSFTQAHLMKDYGIVDYARFDGYAYTFVPIYTRYRAGSETGYLDADKLYPRFMGNDAEVESLFYGNIAKDGVLVDHFVRYNISAARLRENFARVATEFLRRGAEEDIIKAEALLDRGIEVLPSEKIGFTHSNTMPYLRGYYTIANYYLAEAIEELEIANKMFEDMLGISTNVEEGVDKFTYFYDLSDAASEYHSTAIHRGIDVEEVNPYLLRSDELFAKAEEAYNKGDILAAEYIKIKGEWVAYYLQFATYDSFSMTISDKLYNAMLDIIETLDTSHMLAGSFEWVANGGAEAGLVENPLNFDNLVYSYLDAVRSLTPADIDDPQMALMEGHICNLFEIYNGLPLSRIVSGRNAPAVYIYELEDFLSQPAQYDILNIYGKIQ